MTLVNIQEVFNQCDYPFFKEAEVQNTNLHCKLYSTQTSYNQEVELPIIHFESAIHQLSIALIRLRSYELLNQQEQIVKRAM